MKKLYTEVLCYVGVMLLLPIALRAQTVYTPKGTAVPVILFSEMSPDQITSTNNSAAAQFPNAQRLNNSSRLYNCHSYAWYLSEAPGSPLYWMSPGNATYWQDGSYIQICNESQAAKIDYASDDHSAIRSVVAGKYDSKWGQWPLMRHNPTDVPYNSSSRKYYAPTKINASSTTICGDASFSVAAFSGGTYTWSSSSNIVLSSTSGSSITANSSGEGAGWVQVVISSSCSSTSVTTRLNVSVGTPTAITGPSNLCAGTTATYSIPNLPSGVTPTWSSSNTSYATINPSTGVATPVGTNTSSVTFTATIPATTTCGALTATKVVRAGSPGLVLVGTYTSASTGVTTSLSNNSNPVVPRGTYYINMTPLTAQSRAPTTATINPWSFGDAGSAGAYNTDNNQRGVIMLTGYTGASVNISAVDACGSTASFYFRLSPAATFRLAASPNPATSDLTVEAVISEPSEAQNVTTDDQPSFTAQLYNSYGIVVLKKDSQKGKVQFDTRSLPAGLYTLRAGAGKEAVSKHIQVTH